MSLTTRALPDAAATYSPYIHVVNILFSLIACDFHIDRRGWICLTCPLLLEGPAANVLQDQRLDNNGLTSSRQRPTRKRAGGP